MKIGKISETVLKRSVLKQLTNRRNEVRLGAVPGEDCAVLAFESGEQTLVSTQSAEDWRMEASADREKEAAAGPQSDCVKEYAAVCAQGAAVSTGRDAVLYGLHRALNNIAAEGGKPVAVFLSLLLPPSFEERGLKAMMVQAEEVCAALGVQIAGGHTAVTDAVCRPAATVTAVGKAVPERILPTGGARPGADLVVTKWVALEGTAVAAKEKEAELLKRFPHLELTVMVRGEKALNDADREDAAQAGFDRIARVVDNGCGVAGTPLAYVSEEARKLLTEADVILAKGQGNFETMHGCGLNIYYAFLCKCDWFQKRFDMEKNKGMFVAERTLL